MNIDAMLSALIEREGEYSDHPADRGGPTRWGVTEHEARANGYLGDMRNYPKTDALALYREKYWLRPSFDKVMERSEAVAEELFDTGVNMGPKRAAMFLQRALNVLNRGTLFYPNAVVDGDIGPMTLYALDQLSARRGAEGFVVLLRMLNALQSVRYIEIAENDPTQEEFEFGWQKTRVGAL